MIFEKLVPNIFYVDINEGLKLFENTALAKEHNPEFRLVTKNIEEVYAFVSKRNPEFLHPNLNKITLRPWGAKEFALIDRQLGIIIQQW